jgi:hypothetical protein
MSASFSCNRGLPPERGYIAAFLDMQPSQGEQQTFESDRPEDTVALPPPFEYVNPWRDADVEIARPILGGDTSITLTAASVLQSLGVRVAPLGSAVIDDTSGDPVARFVITGGTEGPDDDTSVILHQGSGLQLSNQAGAVELRDFRIDTENSVIRSDVTVNGTVVGNIAAFDIGSDGSLALTNTASGVVSQVLGSPSITPDVVISIAAPAAFVDPACLWDYGTPDNGGMRFLESPGTHPIIGGETKVTLTSAATLQSLHIGVSPLGSAAIDPSTPDPVAAFPVTGGTLGPGESESVILHQGSGLELADSDSHVGLRDFLIDTQNQLVDANVTINDLSFGNVAVFEIGEGGTLLLTSAAANVLSDAFDAPAIIAGLAIGTASPSPIALSGGMDA